MQESVQALLSHSAEESTHLPSSPLPALPDRPSIRRFIMLVDISSMTTKPRSFRVPGTGMKPWAMYLDAAPCETTYSVLSTILSMQSTETPLYTLCTALRRPEAQGLSDPGRVTGKWAGFLVWPWSELQRTRTAPRYVTDAAIPEGGRRRHSSLDQGPGVQESEWSKVQRKDVQTCLTLLPNASHSLPQASRGVFSTVTLRNADTPYLRSGAACSWPSSACAHGMLELLFVPESAGKEVLSTQ